MFLENLSQLKFCNTRLSIHCIGNAHSVPLFLSLDGVWVGEINDISFLDVGYLYFLQKP